MLSRRAVLAAGALAPSVARAQVAGAAPAPPTVDELLADPVLLDTALSPDGKRLAVLREERIDGRRAAFVLLHDVTNLAAPPTVVRLGANEVNLVEWANPERLLVWMSFRTNGRGDPYGLFYGETFIHIPVRRVVSVSLTGEDPVILFSGDNKLMKKGFDLGRVVDFMADDPKLILMQVWNDRRGAYCLYKVDVYTGAATEVEQGISVTDGWLTQGGVPMLRIDSNSRGTVAWIYGRPPGETEWKLIRKSRYDEFRKLPEFDIVAPTPEAGVFLICIRDGERDTKAIRKFDIRTMSFGEVVAEQSGRDLEGAFVDENLKLVGAAFVDDKLNYSFADPQLAAHFRGVNGYFGGTANVALYDVDVEHSKLILKVSGPKEPAAFHLYDRTAKRLDLIGPSMPALTPERLAGTEVVKVKTRDGAEITAYLSTPIGAAKGPLPMVVLPHGGPEARDQLEWNLFVQAYAARGWLVLQPNFRGSGGYGKAFADAGRKRWGERMQEDVEDCVAQVVASGRADPKRLAICGASYGGYAALMGAVRKPELYRAVVAIAGVADTLEFLAQARSDGGADSPAYAYWLRTIGDPKADEAMLKAASPALRAAEIAAPVLLIHGTEDAIVDVRQSRIMGKALKAANKPYVLTELEGEGHRDWNKSSWKRVLNLSGEFIARQI